MLTAEQITEYTEKLNAAIAQVEQRRVELGHQKTSDFDNLVASLAALVEALQTPILELDWFLKYLRLYETAFFNSALDPYIAVIGDSYLSIYNALSQAKKIEVSRLNPSIYRFINVTGINDQSLKRNVIDPYISYMKIPLLAELVTQEGLRSGYDAKFGTTSYTVDYRDRENNTLKITLWVEAKYIHVVIGNQGIEDTILNMCLDKLFNLILA